MDENTVQNNTLTSFLLKHPPTHPHTHSHTHTLEMIISSVPQGLTDVLESVWTLCPCLGLLLKCTFPLFKQIIRGLGRRTREDHSKVGSN